MSHTSYHGITFSLLPHSILSPLHEPLLDPKDGHGARSVRDVMILQLWEAAKKGDDKALMRLLKLILDEGLDELKAAQGRGQVVRRGGGRMKIRSLLPVASLLKIIDVEWTEVPPERDGYVTVTRRRRAILKDWFQEFAFGRQGVDPKVVDEVRAWTDAGSIQRPHRGECWD